MLAVVDTGPLYAVVDADDRDHERCLRALETPGLRLFIPALVVAEMTYLLGRRLGPKVEAAFLAGLASFDVEAPTATDWPRIAELVEQHADFHLSLSGHARESGHPGTSGGRRPSHSRFGGVDASVIALAERLRTHVIITLDRHHFEAVRPVHSAAWQLLPE